MTVALRQTPMTREQFFAWAEAQDTRYEFDGFQPVAMTGGSNNHNRITLSIHRALYVRLKGSGCEPLGPDAGIATIGRAVRYPDALITCTKAPGSDHIVPGVVVVFEVVSPSDEALDREIKRREYLAVPSIHTYVIVEQTSIALTVLSRRDDNTWTASTLSGNDVLHLHAPDLEIPTAEFYQDTDLIIPESREDAGVGSGEPTT